MSLQGKRKRLLEEKKNNIFDEEYQTDFLLPVHEDDQGDTSEEELVDFQLSDDDDCDDNIRKLYCSDDDTNDSGNCDEWQDVGFTDECDEKSDDSDFVSSRDKNESNHDAVEENKSDIPKKNIKDINSNESGLSNKAKSVKKLRKSALRSKSKATSVISGKVASHKKGRAIKLKLKEPVQKKNMSTYEPTFDECATSDEEDLRNTVGNVPINWYDEFDHIGYALDGLPIRKPQKGDALDKFLERLENPDLWRTVFDKQTGQDVRLSDEDLDLVKRLISHTIPDPKFDMYTPFQDLYSHEVMEMPLSGRASSKKCFLPSKYERQKVARIAYLIRRGLYKNKVPKKNDQTNCYDLWKPRGEDEPPLLRKPRVYQAPAEPNPAHVLSYNPPPEYILKNQSRRDENKDFILNPMRDFRKLWRKFSSVREVPSYRLGMKERLTRLRDLYLGPRKEFKKMVGTSKDMLPEIPDRKDLRPFPTTEELVFMAHRSVVRSIAIHPGGKYMVSGGDDKTIRVWEISTARCLKVVNIGEPINKVTWNPNPNLFLVGVAAGNFVILINPESHLTNKIVIRQTNAIFNETVDQGNYQTPHRVSTAVKWRKPSEIQASKGYKLVLEHFHEVKEIVWHHQGDYFVSVIPEGLRRSVVMHQLSRWRSQIPFQGNKGRVQTVFFHPKQPSIFVVNQTCVKLYNLKTQKLTKKIQANSRWVSCIAVHPGGDHFVIGGYDRKVNWFELSCTKRPHIMKYHSCAVRAIKFHRKYPLFASASDDRKLCVLHGMVYDDLVKDPRIVLLRRLYGHMKFDDYFVMDVEWHPFEPFLFSAGADGTIRLWR